MVGYVKLSEPPMWCIQYPTCSACEVDLDTDGDGWTCPSCGTTWPMSAGDGDKGELHESWAGEELPGPVLTAEQAAAEACYRNRLRLHEEYPKAVPRPIPPKHMQEAGK